jgi:hypothetical protein
MNTRHGFPLLNDGGNQVATALAPATRCQMPGCLNDLYRSFTNDCRPLTATTPGLYRSRKASIIAVGLPLLSKAPIG